MFTLNDEFTKSRFNFTKKKRIHREALDVNKIRSLKFFKIYKYDEKEKDLSVELNVFLCNIEDVAKMDVKEGKPIRIKIREAIQSNISKMDKEILDEINHYIEKKCG